MARLLGERGGAGAARAKMKIVWSPTAIEDLGHIRSYIAARNPPAAATTAQAILRAVETLSRFPAMGRPGRLPDTRELVIPGTPFVVPYRVSGGGLEIIAVLHGRQRWPRGTP